MRAPDNNGASFFPANFHVASINLAKNLATPSGTDFVGSSKPAPLAIVPINSRLVTSRSSVILNTSPITSSRPMASSTASTRLST